jgi:hypothetical protein
MRSVSPAGFGEGLSIVGFLSGFLTATEAKPLGDYSHLCQRTCGPKSSMLPGDSPLHSCQKLVRAQSKRAMRARKVPRATWE